LTFAALKISELVWRSSPASPNRSREHRPAETSEVVQRWIAVMSKQPE